MAEAQQNTTQSSVPAKPPANQPASLTAKLRDKLSEVKINIAKKSMSKPMIAGNVINAIIFALIAAAVVVGNYFLEARYASGQEAAPPSFDTLDYAKPNILPGNGVLRFSNENSSPSMKISDAGANEYIFYLDSGRVWGNFSISSAHSNIVIANRIILIPAYATFDLSFDGERANLAVYDGNVYVIFWHENLQNLKENPLVLYKYFDDGLNNLLVPRDTQVEIPLKKVNDEIKPLLFSKLAKEFKYASIPSADKESKWALDNMKEDTKFVESVKQKFISDVISQGAKVKDGILSRFVFWAEENLTFVPYKKEKMFSEHTYAYLDDAIYYINQGDTAEAQQSLSRFISFGKPVPEKYLNDLIVFGPSENQTIVSRALLQNQFSQVDPLNLYRLSDRLWLDIYRGIDESGTVAEKALDDYYKYFDRTLGNISTKDEYRMYLIYQNQLFDNLLLRYAVFYKDGYFAIKNAMEQALLAQYDGQLKDELKQAFISKKIDFMKRLRKHFFDEELEVHEAKEIFSRLFEEVDDLMPADTSSVAVIELFQEQLSDIDDFWGYLSSPEYHMGTYGLTHEERYDNYLKERDTIYSFINLQEEVLGEKVEVEQDVLNVIEEVQAVFEAHEDVTDIEVGEVKDVEQRYVGVKAVLGGYPFEAQYDRDTDTLNEVYVYEELISDRAVKLDSLLSVLQTKFADLAEDMDVSEGDEVTLETSAQRFARIYIAKKIEEYGFIADLENVSVVDELNAIYRVEGVVLDGVDNIVITFDILMNGELVTNVLLMIDDNPSILDGKYTLEELSTMVAGGELFEEETAEKVFR